MMHLRDPSELVHELLDLPFRALVDDNDNSGDDEEEQ